MSKEVFNKNPGREGYVSFLNLTGTFCKALTTEICTSGLGSKLICGDQFTNKNDKLEQYVKITCTVVNFKPARNIFFYHYGKGKLCSHWAAQAVFVVQMCSCHIWVIYFSLAPTLHCFSNSTWQH